MRANFLSAYPTNITRYTFLYIIFLKSNYIIIWDVSKIQFDVIERNLFHFTFVRHNNFHYAY